MSNLILERVYNVKNIDTIVEKTTNKICALNHGIKRADAKLIVLDLVVLLEVEVLNAKQSKKL